MPEEELKTAVLHVVSKRTTLCDIGIGLSCLQVFDGIPISLFLHPWSSKAQTAGAGKSCHISLIKFYTPQHQSLGKFINHEKPGIKM